MRHCFQSHLFRTPLNKKCPTFFSNFKPKIVKLRRILLKLPIFNISCECHLGVGVRNEWIDWGCLYSHLYLHDVHKDNFSFTFSWYRFVTCGQKDTHPHVAELICTFFTNLLCQRTENFVASTRNLNIKGIQGKPRKRRTDVVQREALHLRSRRSGDREKLSCLLKEVRAQNGL
jgi:hypothetical protein